MRPGNDFIGKKQNKSRKQYDKKINELINGRIFHKNLPYFLFDRFIIGDIMSNGKAVVFLSILIKNAH